jgi:hypothetical protein
MRMGRGSQPIEFKAVSVHMMRLAPCLLTHRMFDPRSGYSSRTPAPTHKPASGERWTGVPLKPRDSFFFLKRKPRDSRATGHTTYPRRAGHRRPCPPTETHGARQFWHDWTCKQCHHKLRPNLVRKVDDLPQSYCSSLGWKCAGKTFFGFLDS